MWSLDGGEFENGARYHLLCRPQIKKLSSLNLPFRYFYAEKARDVLENVPSCFLIVGACYAVLQLVGALLLFDPGEYGVRSYCVVLCKYSWLVNKSGISPSCYMSVIT